MKHVLTKAAAAFCAAATAVCAMQAVTASAINSQHPTTGNTQASCEEPRNMGHNCYYWSVYNYPANTAWDQTVISGKVFGPGYSTTTISGNTQGTPLNGAVAWARKLACEHFGSANTIFTEQPASYANCLPAMKLGDQIVLTRNGQTHAVFVTGINFGNGNDSVTVSELVGGVIKYGVTYTVPVDGQLRRSSNGQTYNISYVVRPVKEGDANGDSSVDIMDVDFILSHTGVYNFPGSDYNTVMGACDLDGDWSISWQDAMAVYMNMNCGKLDGNYSYLVS